jgi:Domain of Unknown Function (DUF1080)
MRMKFLSPIIFLTTVLVFFSCNRSRKMNIHDNGVVNLFNGKNFDGWNLMLRSKDSLQAAKVFSVGENGTVHVFKNFPDSFELFSGKNKTHGLMYTTKKYSQFVFHFEYKWGGKIFNNFDNYQYDAGCYYHVLKQKVWPDGIEYQVRYNHLTNKNHTGDYWASNTFFRWTEGKDKQFALPENGGVEIEKGRYEHRGADVPYNGLNNQWNVCEIIVMGSEYSIHKLNGRLVNYATDLSVEEGFIGLQSETAEIFYRNIFIREIPEFIPASSFLKNLK